MSVYVPALNERDLNKIILSLQQLGAGRSNAVGVLTFTPNTTTTTVTDINVAAGSTIQLQPTNAASATEFGAGNWYITPSNGSFIITHASSATTGRTYRYSIHG